MDGQTVKNSGGGGVGLLQRTLNLNQPRISTWKDSSVNFLFDSQVQIKKASSHKSQQQSPTICPENATTCTWQHLQSAQFNYMSMCTCVSDREWWKGRINTKLHLREFCQNDVFSFNYTNASNTNSFFKQPFNLYEPIL